MSQYTTQQMSGHKDYSLRTFTGNWREDVACEGGKMRDYVIKRANGTLVTQQVEEKMKLALHEVDLTPKRADGCLRFGDVIMVQSANSKGCLAVDVSRTSEGRQGNYHVSVAKSSTPVARTVWSVQKAKDRNMQFYKGHKEGEVVHYGQQVKIVNKFMSDAHLNLCAELPTPLTCLRGNTTGQERGEVTACIAGGLETVFTFLPGELSWEDEVRATPVNMGDVVVLKSVKVNQCLSSEEQRSKSGAFGPEEEVSTFHHKQQFTKKECKAVGPRNMWGILCAPEGSSFTRYEPFAKRDVMLRVREKILERSGGLGFRGIVRSLRIMDDNGDKKLSRRELKEGMATYGVTMTAAELDAAFSEFDRDGDGVISITEFLVAIRGYMNERRTNMVKEAYTRLDTNGNGTASFEELNKIYGQNLDRHPAVLSGHKTHKQVMMEFIACWDKSGDGIVTMKEFLDYYNDISVSIDNDDYFELMIRNAWHISGGEGWCENTSCRRVLVIHHNGSQTVEEIKNDLGIGPEDIDKMKENLIAQGITDIKAIKLTS
eukprot:TRINITY_DN1697_c0_g2_i1.p1 TRINITY_DN1697_c0_g2~~TRINITY_DN1697_c0_g2_i1.p1  ORF type:complete len:544 (+),score=161.51 TRINITY_DN1697_c0_g2_i1:54-1685(+)